MVPQNRRKSSNIGQTAKESLRGAFSTWLMVYVLPCYPERKDDPAGPGDPADQAWLPYLVRWINSGGIKVIFEDPRPEGDGWAGQDGR